MYSSQVIISNIILNLIFVIDPQWLEHGSLFFQHQLQTVSLFRAKQLLRPLYVWGLVRIWVLFFRLHCSLITSVWNASERNWRPLQVSLETKRGSWHWPYMSVLSGYSTPKREAQEAEREKCVGSLSLPLKLREKNGKIQIMEASFLCFGRTSDLPPGLKQ